MLPNLMNKSYKESTCKVRKLDDVINSFPNGKLDLIKFDIEGMEIKTFGASNLAISVPYIVGELKGNQRWLNTFLDLFPNSNITVNKLYKKLNTVFIEN